MYQSNPPRYRVGGRRNNRSCRSIWDLGDRRMVLIYFRHRSRWYWGWRRGWRVRCWWTWVSINLTRWTMRGVREERRIRRERRTADQDLGAHYWYLAMDVGGLDVILGVPQDARSLLS